MIPKLKKKKKTEILYNFEISSKFTYSCNILEKIFLIKAVVKFIHNIYHYVLNGTNIGAKWYAVPYLKGKLFSDVLVIIIIIILIKTNKQTNKNYS